MEKSAWATIESSEDEDEEEEVETPSQNIDVNVKVLETVKQKFYPPYIVEIKCADFEQDSVDRNAVGHFFQDRGCNIVRLEVWKNGTARMEFEDEDSIITCMSMHGKLFDSNSLEIEASGSSTNRKNVNNRHNSQRSYENQRDYRDRDRDRDSTRDNRGRENRGRSSRQFTNRGSTTLNSTATSPTERPKIVILPRTLPLENIGKPVSSLLKPQIFGEGKPQDETELDRRKSLAASQPARSPSPTTAMVDKSTSLNTNPPFPDELPSKDIPVHSEPEILAEVVNNLDIRSQEEPAAAPDQSQFAKNETVFKRRGRGGFEHREYPAQKFPNSRDGFESSGRGERGGRIGGRRGRGSAREGERGRGSRQPESISAGADIGSINVPIGVDDLVAAPSSTVPSKELESLPPPESHPDEQSRKEPESNEGDSLGAVVHNAESENVVDPSAVSSVLDVDGSSGFGNSINKRSGAGRSAGRGRGRGRDRDRDRVGSRGPPKSGDADQSKDQTSTTAALEEKSNPPNKNVDKRNPSMNMDRRKDGGSTRNLFREAAKRSNLLGSAPFGKGQTDAEKDKSIQESSSQVALTDEEKFNRAQQQFHRSSRLEEANTNKQAKARSKFAALDDENEDD